MKRHGLQFIEAGNALISGSPRGDEIGFQHAILAQVGLPRSRVSGSSFQRTSGNASLLVSAGQMWNGKRWVPQPVPYGVKPRLALIHVCSEAIRRRNAVVDVGGSVREFLHSMGLGDSGKEYAAFRRQMMALAACEMRLGFQDWTLKCSPIDGFNAWLGDTGEQHSMWSGIIRLSAPFYETLSKHAVPLDNRAVASLRSSALAIDVYTWLAHRLWRVGPTPVKVTWHHLHEQFGQEFVEIKDFKRRMLVALRAALAVYPDAKVAQVSGGLLLSESKPPVARTTFRAAWLKPSY